MNLDITKSFYITKLFYYTTSSQLLSQDSLYSISKRQTILIYILLLFIFEVTNFTQLKLSTRNFSPEKKYEKLNILLHTERCGITTHLGQNLEL